MYLLNNEILKNIKLIALYNVGSRSVEWFTEVAYRHYSKTYHTPLHLAKSTMTPAEVIQIYMEDDALEMSPEDRLDMISKLTNKPQPMLDINQQTEEDSEIDDEEWVMQQMALASKQEEKKQTNDSSSLMTAAKEAQQAVQELYNAINKPVPEELEGTIKFDKE